MNSTLGVFFFFAGYTCQPSLEYFLGSAPDLGSYNPSFAMESPKANPDLGAAKLSQKKLR
jgi:hypothetical protein